MFALSYIEPRFCHKAAKELSVRVEPVSKLGRASDKLECLQSPTYNGWCKGVRKKIWSPFLSHILDDFFTGSDDTTRGSSESFPKGRSYDIYPTPDSTVFPGASSSCPHETSCMRIVDHHKRTIFFC